MSRPKIALLVCGTIAVLCPSCSEPQPAPDNGSDLWEPHQVKAGTGVRQCVACDEPFLLLAPSTVKVPPS